MTARRPIDDRRKAIFLQILRQTGSVSAAAAAATPHSDGGKEAYRAGYRTFLDEMRRDPEFAQAVEEAKQHALGLVEEAIATRSMSPERTPVFVKGVLVGWKESWRDANALLLKRAAVLDPDRWIERRRIEGEIQHRHAHAVGVMVFEVTGKDLLLMEDEQERRLLTDLLVKLDDLIKEKDRERRSLPAPGAASDEAGRRDAD